MTFNEFKAWFEGYCENINNDESLPNMAQWQRIKEKLAEVGKVEPVKPPLNNLQQLQNSGQQLYGQAANAAGQQNYQQFGSVADSPKKVG